jgi:hypothetical protein
MLLVQGPQAFEIELTVNGAHFRVGSTVAFRLLAPDLLEIFVLDGKVEVLDDARNPTGLVIQSGQRSTACLSEPDNRGLDGESNDRVVACEFTAPEWVPLDEIGLDWCMLQNVPASILNYPVDLFCPGEMLPTPVPPPTATPPPIVFVLPVRTQPAASVTPLAVDCRDFRLLGPFEGTIALAGHLRPTRRIMKSSFTILPANSRNHFSRKIHPLNSMLGASQPAANSRGKYGRTATAATYASQPAPV